jgi:hypothetical protein
MTVNFDQGEVVRQLALYCDVNLLAVAKAYKEISREGFTEKYRGEEPIKSVIPQGCNVSVEVLALILDDTSTRRIRDFRRAGAIADSIAIAAPRCDSHPHSAQQQMVLPKAAKAQIVG